MSVIKIAVLTGGAPIDPAKPRVSTTVAVTDSSGAAQAFSLDGTENPVGVIPQVTVAAGPGSVMISDIAADGSVLGVPVSVKYTTVAAGPQNASSGATVTVLQP
jgi:hypothetical protein